MFNQLVLKFRYKIDQVLHPKSNNIEKLNQNSGNDSDNIKFCQNKTQLKISFLAKTLGGFPELVSLYQRISQTSIVAIKRIVSINHYPKLCLLFWIGLGASSGTIVLGYGMYQLENSIMEPIEDVLTYAPPQTLIIKSSDGIILQEVGPVTHEQLKIWQIPELIIQAFIASEDHRFESHRGVDIHGVVRAAFSNLLAGEVVEGGSTITQQLARIVFLNQEINITRKIKEMRLAQKIERKLTKDQILERYLNLVYLGSGAYGIADAAWVYFSKPIDQLTIAEVATLAGIVPAPSVYSPIQNKAATIGRRNLVLQRMKLKGFINTSQAKKAIAEPIILKPNKPKRLQRKAPYFTDYIQLQLPKYISKEVLQQGGIVVETTLNNQWQEAAEAAVEKAVTEYGPWQGFKQAALTAVDPRNGQIKAMVGGDDYKNHQYNRVTQAQRQPGSTFKTFVYTAAIAAGLSPDQTFLNSPYIVDGYRPENYGDRYSGVPVSIRKALASSLNVVAVQTLVKVGWNPIIEVAKKMGIKSKLKPTYSLALGAWEVNLLELTSAYGTLANLGVHQRAYGIDRVLDRRGQILYQAKFPPKGVIDSDTTAVMTSMLQGVVTGGTGSSAQLEKRPVAGKTGTSDKARDLWFIGYIPQLTAGVWLGNDDNRPTRGSSTTAAGIWKEFMQEVVKDTPIESFPLVPNIKGRKPIIKAEPISPKNKSDTVATRSRSSRSRSMVSNHRRKQTVIHRQRAYINSQQAASTKTKAQSATPSSTSSQTAVTSQTPSSVQATSPVPNSLAAPSAAKKLTPTPKTEFVLPAPPASRKTN
ncbi:transglycosylase domain-containing protein [Cyanobacterium sp. uoEpiScrs1]|uniref:transglycosylase domain-containing protein n=1 Tax=Cyanobacterium sp. uoEpiScrs1 TaxID=2976343 RepID=UPI00226993CB|nr:PBP1A family penicillin-binding protein [Cyanobacterium sp. uoEpiScrs1]